MELGAQLSRRWDPAGAGTSGADGTHSNDLVGDTKMDNGARDNSRPETIKSLLERLDDEAPEHPERVGAPIIALSDRARRPPPPLPSPPPRVVQAALRGEGETTFLTRTGILLPAAVAVSAIVLLAPILWMLLEQTPRSGNAAERTPLRLTASEPAMGSAPATRGPAPPARPAAVTVDLVAPDRLVPPQLVAGPELHPRFTAPPVDAPADPRVALADAVGRLTGPGGPPPAPAIPPAAAAAPAAIRPVVRIVVAARIDLVGGQAAALAVGVEPASALAEAHRLIVRGLPASVAVSGSERNARGDTVIAMAALPGARIEAPLTDSGDSQLDLELLDHNAVVLARAEMHLSVRPGHILREVSADKTEALMARGLALAEAGDIASARLLLERAAEGGSARGAFALAETFDPAALAGRRVLGLAGDVVKARFWYERARALGLVDAEARLQRLGGK